LALYAFEIFAWFEVGHPLDGGFVFVSGGVSGHGVSRRLRFPTRAREEGNGRRPDPGGREFQFWDCILRCDGLSSSGNSRPRTDVRTLVRELRSINAGRTGRVDERGRMIADSLGQYMEGLDRSRLLTAEEEVELAQSIEAGAAARTRLESEK